MTERTYTPVRRSVTVAAPLRRAFRVFTEQLGTWWPKQHRIGEAEIDDVVVEPMVGGRWFEVGVDGKECDTGRVTAYQPPDRLTLAWQLDGAWRYDPDPAHASEVDVRFIAEGPDRTRVELEHRGFERHGDGAEGVWQGVSSLMGWTHVLELFAEKAAA
jgi:uncharacterized protein YndB with AHSA1/START domain